VSEPARPAGSMRFLLAVGGADGLPTRACGGEPSGLPPRYGD